MMEALVILTKAVCCGGVVWALVRSVDGAPPHVVARVIALPMTLAAGLLAVAGTQGEAFLISATFGAAMSLPAMLAFIVTVARLFYHLSAPALIGAGLAAWCVTIAVATATGPWDLQTSLCVGIAALALSHLAFPFRVAFTARIGGMAARRAWPTGVQAGAMVLVLSTISGTVGPVASAWIASLPMAMSFVTLGMKRAASGNAAATYQSARLGVPSLFAYLASVVVLTPPLGGTAATLVAVLPATALSSLIVAARQFLTPKEIAL